MNALENTTSSSPVVAPGAARYSVHVGGAACEVRARLVSPIADVLGFEQEMDVAVAGVVDLASLTDDHGMIVDLLDSRMIAPPRPRRRRDRAVSSRAMFYGSFGR
jgi:hypothetical protein